MLCISRKKGIIMVVSSILNTVLFIFWYAAHQESVICMANHIKQISRKISSFVSSVRNNHSLKEWSNVEIPNINATFNI